MPLTDVFIRSLKPLEKPYKHFDGGGLHIHVTPNGSKLCRMSYRFDGKVKLLSFGEYPTERRKPLRIRILNPQPVCVMKNASCAKISTRSVLNGNNAKPSATKL